MSQTSDEVLTKALSLSAEERLSLAARLLESVEGPIDSRWDAAWMEELRQREGESEVGADEALALARDALKRS